MISNNLYTILLSFFVFLSLGCDKSDNPSDDGIINEAQTMDVMSFNIRGDQKTDGVNQWEFRKERVVDLVKKYNPAVLGLQEARPLQLEYLKQQLPNYGFIGGGNQAGEYTVILYNKTMVDFVPGSDNMIWLSETPNQTSLGWDALFVRILISATFRDKESNKEFLIYNTHLDHRGEISREESAKLIVSTILDEANNRPVILLGDFNHTQNDPPYSILTSTESSLKNARLVSLTPHQGPMTRSSGFSVADHSNKPPIDFIFVNNKIKVHTHAYLIDSHNGFYPSDHLPVLAGIELE